MVVGQYKGRKTEGKEFPGYREDPTVDDNSLTPTFAATVLHIKNRRWDGVPFMLKCGKGLDESKAEIRIQFHDVPANLYTGFTTTNELVIRVQPDEAIYFSIMNKQPGLKEITKTSKLDFTYKSKSTQRIPDAYERLVGDVIRGKKSNFVNEEELRVSWKLFTPILKNLEKNSIIPETYPFGSRGPVESDYLAARYNIKWSED
jgi:glucose-6-phosphate 1-dehydrogenase